MRRALLVVLLAACVAVPAAHADGDPASDYLIGEQAFLPYDAKIPKDKQRELVALMRAVNSAGYKIRVAIIWSPYDLGAVTSLWNQPRVYARFLGAELQFIYKQRLLIVMPAGFGFNWPRHSTEREYAILGKIPIGEGAVGLVEAVETAVQRLAADSGVHVQAAATAKSKQGHGRLIVILAIVGGVAVAVAARLALRRRPKRP